MRGVCDSAYPYYLDTIGISLSKAAKLADSSSVTGRQLFDDAIGMAWERLKSDINIDGFGLKGILETYTNSLGDYVEYADPIIYEKDFTRGCDLESFCVNDIEIKIINNAKISVIVDGTTIYNETHNNEIINIPIGKCYDANSLNITVAVSPIIGDGSDVVQVAEDSEGVGFRYNITRQCSEDILYCRYAMFLVMALMYKTGALLLNSIVGNDRYNDLIAYGKVDIEKRIAQLDSDFAMLPKELRSGEVGLYQKEIKKINAKLEQVAKDSKCKCCFECKNPISYNIAIP